MRMEAGMPACLPRCLTTRWRPKAVMRPLIPSHSPGSSASLWRALERNVAGWRQSFLRIALLEARHLADDDDFETGVDI
jgi:hypothetical protein